LPKFCANFVETAVQNPEAALLRAPWQNIDAEGRILSHDYLLSVPQEQKAPANLTAQRYGPKVSFAAFAIRRDAYVASGPILREIESLADWALFLQLTPFGSYVRLSEIGSSYRVGHEGNRFRDRAPKWLRDELRIFSEVIPLAADRMNLQNRGWIREASRANLQRYLAAASSEFAPQERAPLLADLTPWAEFNDQLQLVARFKQGEMIRERSSLAGTVRRWLRPLAHRLAHSVAHRS
jgi:hypothetical protein